MMHTNIYAAIYTQVQPASWLSLMTYKPNLLPDQCDWCDKMLIQLQPSFTSAGMCKNVLVWGTRLTAYCTDEGIDTMHMGFPHTAMNSWVPYKYESQRVALFRLCNNSLTGYSTLFRATSQLLINHTQLNATHWQDPARVVELTLWRNSVLSKTLNVWHLSGF